MWLVKVAKSCPTLQPHGLYSSWNSPGQNTGVGSLSLLQGIFPNPVELRFPTLQADSLPAEPPGKPKNTGVGSLSLLQRIFLTQELNRGLLHCRRILYQLSHQGSPYMWLSKSLTLSELLIISFLSPIVLTVDISQVSLQLSPVTSSVIIVLQRSWWEDHELSVVLISKSQIWSLLTILTVTTLFQGMFTFCFIYS